MLVDASARRLLQSVTVRSRRLRPVSVQGMLFMLILGWCCYSLSYLFTLPGAFRCSTIRPLSFVLVDASTRWLWQSVMVRGRRLRPVPLAVHAVHATVVMGLPFTDIFVTDPPFGSLPAAAELGAVNLIQPREVSTPSSTLAADVLKPTNTAGEAAAASFRPRVVGEGTPPIPARIVKAIQTGQFADFAELLSDNLGFLRRLQASSIMGASEAGQWRLRQVSSLGTWVQCFAVYAAIALQAHRSRALDLLAYLRLVVHEAQCHSGTEWLLYDNRFRQLAAYSSSLSWGQLHAPL